MTPDVASGVLKCLRLSVFSLLLVNARCHHLLDAFGKRSSPLECHLLSTFQSLLVLQKAQEQPSGTLPPNSQLIVIIQDKSTQTLAAKFYNSITNVFTTSRFLNILVNRKNDEVGVAETLRTLDNHHNEITAVVVATENLTLAASVMSAVCSHSNLKWTHLLHTTEWVIAGTNSQAVGNVKALGDCTDYMTVMLSTSSGLAVARKSRGQTLRLRKPRSYWSVEDLRAVFKDLGSAKKSGLESMHLPVAVLNSSKKHGDDRDVFSRRYERFAVALAQLLATTLHFTISFVVPAEHLYGYVNEDQSATGLTGLLVRREAAFCSMGMSKTRNRLHAIEFADTQILYEPIQASYRLTGNHSSIDLWLIDIVHPGFYLLLLGPMLVLVTLGLVTHVLTNACTEATPKFSKQRLRTLSSFPDHMCFHVDTNYAGQTGRVLRASWSVFWLVFSAAVSAYFVISFTVKPAELKINTPEKLLHTRKYALGLLGTNSALMDTLKTSNDWVQAALWERISSANKSDPSILSSNYAAHISRLLAADYVFIHHFGVVDMPMFVEADYSNVRSHHIHSLDGLAAEFLAIPKNVFFKDQLNHFVTILGETGILQYLELKFNISRKKARRTSPLECQCPVGMSRIQMLVYVTLCNLGVCWLCLLAEIVYDKLWTNSASGGHRQQLWRLSMTSCGQTQLAAATDSNCGDCL